MPVDQPRHDPLAGGIDGVHALKVFGVDIRGQSADAANAGAPPTRLHRFPLGGRPDPSIKVPPRIMVVSALFAGIASSRMFGDTLQDGAFLLWKVLIRS